MRAIHIRIREDTDLAIAQIAEIGLIGRSVRINSNRYRNIMHLIIGKEPITLGLPSVKYLTTQRQDGLIFFIATHFC